MMAAEETKETWFNAEIQRFGGEITLMSPEPDAAKAEEYFERALAVARQQQAKSFELRAAMSLARLWRDQGKVQQARELLAPVYGWFTEGFELHAGQRQTCNVHREPQLKKGGEPAPRRLISSLPWDRHGLSIKSRFARRPLHLTGAPKKVT